MGLVRADWHVPEVKMDASDPFEIPERPKPGASPPGGDETRRPGSPAQVDLGAASPVQVSAPEVGSAQLLGDLVLDEAALASRGVTCHLKERDWASPSCSRCPERGDVARAELCRVGLAQERVLANG